MNSILRPTRPSTSDASPRVVDCNLQRLLEHDLCISLHGIGDIPQRHLSADRWTSMDPTCRSQRCSFHNDVQLQHCFLSVSVCLSFASTSLWGLFGKVPATLSLESQIPSIVQQATWDKNQNRKIRWSLFGCRGCSCLDFRRIRIYFDQFWGKLCSQKKSLLDICLRWIPYLGLPDLPQVMPHLEWWIAIYKGCWNMIFAYLCMGLETFLKDICLQTDERPWTPHAVHKDAAFTTMFSCSIVSSLSLFAYLLLPHPCEACSERYQRHWAWNPRFLPLSNKPHETKIKTGKSGGVCLVVVDAAVLIFGELGYILINSGVSCAVKKRVCWTFVCDEFHT